MTRSPERTPAGVEITAVTSAEGLDLRAVATLGIVSWGGEAGEVEVKKRAAALAAEVAGLDPATKGIFIARKSAAPVGFCRVARDGNDASHWWLWGIVVHPAHRRRGIGRALALEGIAYARARGAALIRSETHAHNDVSICFHAGLGFSNEGAFTAADGDEQIAFSLSLR